MNTKIKRAENLFGKTTNVLTKINIDKTYSEFKKSIPKNTYTKDQRKILKDYYKAKKIKGMINSNTNSIKTHLKTSQNEKQKKVYNETENKKTKNNAEGFELFTSLGENYSRDDLRQKYKALALKLHSDKHSSDPNYNRTKWDSIQKAYWQLLKQFN